MRTHNLFGLPGVDLKTEIKTIRLNIRCKPQLARASVLSPYPKTDIFIIAKKYGIITENNFSSHFTGANWTMNRKDISALELRKLDNLSCLFPIFVRFTTLIYLINILIRSPFKKVFSLINSFCESYFSSF